MNKFLAGIVLGFASAAAMANPLKELMENTYGGFSLALSHYPGYCDGASLECHNTANPGWKFYSGFQMSPQVSGEIGYLNYERVSVTRPVPATPWLATGEAMRASGFNVNLAFRRELSPNWSAIGRVGFARMKTVGSIVQSNGSTISAGPTEMHTEPYLGVAAELDVSDLLGQFMPQPLDRFRIQFAVDMTRIEFGTYKRYARLWSMGGGFAF